jgi:hypothetical protein
MCEIPLDIKNQLDLINLEQWLYNAPSDLVFLSLSEDEYVTLRDAFAILYRQIREVRKIDVHSDEALRMSMNYIETIKWLARSRNYGKA